MSRTTSVCRVLIGTMALFVASGSACQAAMLNLVPQGSFSADITSSFSSASYNAATKVLSISGSAIAIDYDQTAPPDAAISSGGPGNPASFMISVLVSNAGALLGPSNPTNLNILGRIPTGPHPSPAYGPLLTGQVVAFGYENSAPSKFFEFIFHVTGGSQQAQFGPFVGVVFDSINGFNGSFASNFTTSINGNADSFAVPEPASAALLALGCCALLAAAARAKRRWPAAS
jgi:hypothetical protein